MRSDAAYLLALTSIPGIGPVGTVSIVRRFKTADELASAATAELDAAVGERCAGLIRSQLNNGWQTLLTSSEARVTDHLKSGIRPIAITETDYPPLLRCIPDPPPILYAKGNVGVLKTLDAVAVIGTRQPTVLGVEVASRVARHFAASGFVVVGGLAIGIDSAAHRSACEVGFTVAVLANALNKVYPAENQELGQQILQRGGALVSELGLGEQTFKNSFVRRDRIQSGMSLAVIPIQTDIEGGTMHTVRFAEAQQRLLFCPMPLNEESGRKQYAGIWHLIRSKRAKPFQSKDYSAVIADVRLFKSRFKEEHGVLDMPVPPQHERLSVASQPSPDKAPQPESSEKSVLQKLEHTFRELDLDEDKQAFNKLVSKLRNRLFDRKSTAKKSPARLSEDQAKLID